MSEHTQSDPVVELLTIEEQLSRQLENPGNKTSKEVRALMEDWLQKIGSPKMRKLYEESLAGLPPEKAQAELLVAIKEQFPKVAKELGYKDEMQSWGTAA